jgi:hypothetical protein
VAGQFLFAGSDGRAEIPYIHPIEDIVVVDDDVADVIADAKLDPEVSRHVHVMRCHGMLH